MEMRKTKDINEVNYINELRKSYEYKEYIELGSSSSKKYLDYTYILSLNDKSVGFCEVVDINDENKSLSINIIFSENNLYVNGKCIYVVIKSVFSDYDINKLVIKVSEENKKMLGILYKSNIHCEGYIYYRKDRGIIKIFFFSMLRKEYNSYRGIIS